VKLTFATQNKHKFEEAQAVLSKHNIQVEQLSVSKVEDKEKPMHEIAMSAAQQLANKHKKPIMVDDTGIFFTAYNNFPGANPRLMFGCLGYEGLLKLLAGKSRDACFLCCVGFCMPKKKPMLFEGKLEGHITLVPFNMEKDVMPYERIFVPKGKTHTLSSMTREQKNEISHRAQAFEKLAAYLLKNRL